MPADFLINYVHVYQNPSDSLQTVGCDPKGFPTAKFIEGNKENYVRILGHEVDKDPLKPIVNGGSTCSSASDCGETTGQCVHGVCKCEIGWTGPKCLVPSYCNNFSSWDENILIYPLEWPHIPEFLVYIGITFLVAFLGSAYLFSKIRRSMLENADYTESKWF